MTQPSQPTPDIQPVIDQIALGFYILVLVATRGWPMISKLMGKITSKATDTGETRKALASVIGDMQVKIEALEKVNDALSSENVNLRADNEALVIRINTLETDLKILKGVVEVLRKPPAPPAETQPITKEDEKGVD